FTPLGETTRRQVDVRIIAATNVDLREAVKEGAFREDLFYRLNVISINLPPLRERHDDILPLAQHFIRKYNSENGRQISDQLSPEVLSLLEGYSWPGNVRELENVIERAVIIARGQALEREDLREEIINPQRAVSQVGGQKIATQIDLSGGISFYDEVN